MIGTHTLAPLMAALVVTGAVLTGCTAQVPEPVEQSETSATTAAPAPPAADTPATDSTESQSCDRLSEVMSDTGGLYWQRMRDLEDHGARDFAQGEVTVDRDGIPVTYTVAPGDVEAVIAERLCAYPNLGSMNHVRTIQPGQVLWLTPDPDSPWVPYFNPIDAPAGFAQIPYQQAIEAAGAAVDAGDVDTVRAIWNDTLRGMFEEPATIDAVQKVVDSGDLGALRQLFS